MMKFVKMKSAAARERFQRIFGTILLATTVVILLYSMQLSTSDYGSVRVVLRHMESSRKLATVEPTSSSKTSVAADWGGANMTIVSGYINIGSFRKGKYLNFSVDDYRKWLRPLALIENPLMFYTDDAEVAKLIAEYRSRSSSAGGTYVRLIRRRELWGFDLVPNISAVINQPGYPKFHPNTVIPEYAAVMHSKFAMMEYAIDADPFNSEYFAWMDSGLFRYETESSAPTLLTLPPGLSRDHIAVNQVLFNFGNISLSDIFMSDTKIFVGGGYLIGFKYTMRKFCEEYRRFTEYFLSIGLSNSDQQVFYGMHANETLERGDIDMPTVRLQRFSPTVDMALDSWYHLRWLSQDEGLRHKQRLALLANVTEESYAEISNLRNTYAAGNNSITSWSECANDVTVVVAFFSFGSRAARVTDEHWEVRDSAQYSNWFRQVARTKNPVVAYFDCPTMMERFRLARVDFGLGNCTKVHLLSRNSLWSWKTLPWIVDSMRQNTDVDLHGAVPEYIAALHSKYALMQLATESNPFITAQFAWLDMSLLRDVPNVLSFAVRKRHPKVKSIEYLPTEELPSHSGKLTLCDLPVSTRYLVGARADMNALSKAYQIAVQVTLSAKQVLPDEVLVKAIYCWKNVSSVVAQKLAYNLPEMFPVSTTLHFEQFSSTTTMPNVVSPQTGSRLS